MKYSKPTLVVFILMVGSTEFVLAQGPPTPPYLPIDSGISFLMLSGIIYGLYSSLKNK